jgi:hypothetical protein
MWITRQRPSDELAIRKVAWDADGRCLATTNRGLAFWTGTKWQPVPLDMVQDPRRLRFVHRASPSRWIVGFDQATIASVTQDGLLDVVDMSENLRSLDVLDGELGDLAVLVDKTEEGRPLLRAMSAWRWVRPIALDKVMAIASIARVGDSCWLVAGRDDQEAGLVALYMPLEFELKLLPTPPVRAFVACAGRQGLETGVACGADGAILWWQQSEPELSTVQGGHDVSAVAVDAAGGGWAAGAGRIWHRDTADGRSAWTCIWEEPEWHVPFVSLFADLGLVIAVTADGAILEGRSTNDDRATEFMARMKQR